MNYTVEFISTMGNDYLHKDGNLISVHEALKDINELKALCKQQHEALQNLTDPLTGDLYEEYRGIITSGDRKRIRLSISAYNKLFNP